MGQRDTMIARYGFLNNQKYSLEKMTLRELTSAYFQYYAIVSYIIIGIISGIVGVMYVTRPWALAIAVIISLIVYPLIWYVLHRYMLHGQYPYKLKLTAKIWKRVHFDHHQDPHDLGVLFGALYTTLPMVFMITAPVGWYLDGFGGAAGAFSAGLFITCFYEYAHCIQHLSYIPKSKTISIMKKRHMEHHFHDENGNYGITNFFWDKLFNTYYIRADRPKKSPTVHNLGYTKAQAKKYPWVAELSGEIGADHPLKRRKK